MSAPFDHTGIPTANPSAMVTDADVIYQVKGSAMTASGLNNTFSADTGDLILAPSAYLKHARHVSQARKKKLREKRKAAQRRAEATGIGLRPKDRGRLIAKFTERGEPVPDYVLSLPSQSTEAGTDSAQRGLKCSEQSLVRLARALKSLLEKEARLEMLVEETSLRAQREFEDVKRFYESFGEIEAIFKTVVVGFVGNAEKSGAERTFEAG